MNWNELYQKYGNRALTSAEEWDIEKINERKAIIWVKENFNVALHLCLIYLLVIFGGKYVMESRPRFDLRKPLLCWSGLLAVFSIIGSIRCWVIFWILQEQSGIRGIICGDDFYVKPIGKFWGLVFCISKAPELVDTVFIVLRKQKLIFLHWYHHITVLLFSWHCYEGQRAGGAVFMVMNFFVHSMMYTYYAFRAAKVKIPRFIALIVTTFQILQMVLGLTTFYFIFLWRNDADCKTTTDHLWYGGVMYLSYLILFCHFFYVAYIKPRVTREDSKKLKEKEDTVSTYNSDAKKSRNGSALESRNNLRSRREGAVRSS